MHRLLVFSWFLNTCTLYFLSKGDLGLDHQLLCISNCVLWSLCSVWIFLCFSVATLTAPQRSVSWVLGGLFKAHYIHTAFNPEHQSLGRHTEHIYLCKSSESHANFLPACLFLVTTPIFVEGLFVMKPINRDGTTPQDTSKTSASRLWNLTRKHRQWLIFGCIVLLVRLPFSLAIPHLSARLLGSSSRT